MTDPTSKSRTFLTLGAFGLGLALIGVTGYVFHLATRPGPEKGSSGVAPDESLEAIGISVQRLLAAGEWKAAGVVLQEAVEKYPEDVDLRQRLAEVYQQQGHSADDVTEKKRLFGLAYAQWAKILTLGERDAAAEFRAGMAASTAGMVDEALSHFEMATSMDPSKPEYALNLGMLQYNTGDLDGARASLTRAITLQQDLAPGWGMLAQIALRTGKREVATERIVKARELDPENPNWRIIEADARAMTDPGASMALIESLDAEYLVREDVLRIARNAYGAAGRFGDAAAIFARASDANPGSIDLALQAADLFERAGNRDQAIAYAKRGASSGDEAAQRMLARLERDDE